MNLRILLAAILLLCCRTNGATCAGEIEIAVVDEATGEPIAVRMHVKDARGRTPRVQGVLSIGDYLVFSGRTVLKLPTGEYTFEMERGPEYRVRTGNFSLKRGDADNKEVQMPRFVDMKKEGWWSGDLHIQRPIKDIELLMLAEDLHVAPVFTWNNTDNLWAGNKLPALPIKEFGDQRVYHVMAGRDERAGGAISFFNLPEPLDLSKAEREFPSGAAFITLAKDEFPLVHIDIEKPFAADLPVWIATGQVDSVGLAHSHLLRGGIIDNEAGGRSRDKMLYPGNSGNGRWTTDIYYHLLNCGLRIPPSASSGVGSVANPLGYNRVYVYCGDDFNFENWWAGLKAGKVIVTNGPLLRPFCEGEPPGHVFKATSDQAIELQINLNLATRDEIEYLEVVQDGKVVHEVRLDKLAEMGGELPKVKFERSGWFLVRAVSSNPQTYRFASSGPWYVDFGEPRISKTSAKFFHDWVYDRARHIAKTLPAGKQQTEVMHYHRQARDFWKSLLDKANAD